MVSKEFADKKQKESLDCGIALALLFKRNGGWKMLVDEFGSRQLLCVLKSKEFREMANGARGADRYSLLSGFSDLLRHEKELGEHGVEIAMEIRQLMGGFLGRKG